MIIGGTLLAHSAVVAGPPTLEALGYQTLRVNGELALGSRPLLAVLIDADGSGLEFPPDHNLDYYLTNIFDVSGAQAVNGFLLENSLGRFTFSRTGHPGVIGPVALSADERFPPTLARAGNDERLADLLFHSNLVARTMMSGLVNFAQFNTDANPDITGDELHLLFIFNEAGSGGATRSPGRVQPPGFSYALNVGSDSGVSFPTPFDTLTHELTHTLGAFDLYGPGCFGLGLTLMSCTSLTPDGRQTFHLDPWHKLKLGWCEPRLRSLGSNGVETLWAAQMMRPDAQVVIYDPARGASEYFILEYRTPNSPNGPGYDRDVAGGGLVIWQVKQGEPPPGQPGVFTVGAPELSRGGNAVWSSGVETPDLVWTDGTSTRTRILVHPFNSGVGSIVVEWRVGQDTEAPPPPPGPGYALGFDGFDDYVTAAPPAIPSGNSPYTIEAWIKPSSMNAGGIVAWGNYANNQVNAFVIAPNGLINYWWGNDLTAPTSNLTGAWHHVAATYNGSIRRIFLDGAQVASDVPAAPASFAPTAFRIGMANAGQHFDGQIDEVRVWNLARSAAQIQETMRSPLGGNEIGLIGYWRFDEGGGVSAFDATGRAANRATLANGPVWIVSTIASFAPRVPPPNGPGYALHLDGINDYVSAAPAGIPSGNSPYTIEAWVKPDRMHVGAIAAWGSYADSQVNAFVLDVDGLVNYWWGNDLKLLWPASLAGAWHHVAATFDGTTRRILLDGISRTNDTPAPPNFSPADFRIGLANAGQYFDGQIDEVRIWKIARSEDQILEAMRRQLWGNEAGLVAYWRLDERSGATATNATGTTASNAALINGPVWVKSTILPWAPTVSGSLESVLSPTSAQLLGSGMANNSQTAMSFEWGFATSYGKSTLPADLGSGATPGNWRTTLTGWMPAATYHARAIGTNGFGTSYGLDILITLPAPPALTIRPGVSIDGTNTILLRWPNPASGYSLQQTASLAATNGNWTDILQPPLTNGGFSEILLPASHQFRAFRLRQP
jgi:M6 family metalloprotease-like protein